MRGSAGRFKSKMHCPRQRRFKSVMLSKGNSTRRRPFPRVSFGSLSRAKRRVHPFTQLRKWSHGCASRAFARSPRRKTCSSRSNDSTGSRARAVPAICSTAPADSRVIAIASCNTNGKSLKLRVRFRDPRHRGNREHPRKAGFMKTKRRGEMEERKKRPKEKILEGREREFTK